MPVEDRAGLGAEALEDVDAVAGGHRTLEEVVRWGLLRTPRALVEDVVTQDEYTLDVIVPYRDGLYLVYDTT